MLKERQIRLAWLFVLPTIFIFFIVALYPLVEVFYYSFTNAQLAGLEKPKFIGLLNYRLLIEDPDFRSAFFNTIRFTIFSVFFETILGLFIALVIHSKFKGRGIVRASVLIPWAIPTVVSAQMWRWMLHDIYGVFNLILVKIGLIGEKIAWLARPETAMPSLIAVDVWKTTPFMALVLLAGLQLIPDELYEASSIDGASWWQQFKTITLPLLTPILFVALTFRTLDALRVFDLIYVMTGGGSNTETLALYNRRVLIDFQELGYGSAVSVAILLIVLLFVFFYMRLMKRGVYGE